MASSYGGGVQNAQLDISVAASSTKIVDGVSGSRIGVIAVYATSAVSGAVTIEDGSGDSFELFPAADGSDSMIAPAGEFLFHISAGVDLDVTTDITGDHYVHVLYKIVPA